MSKLRVLDLFSGIGGFSLGLERTGGFETVAFCEIEPFPRKVLAKHWPEVPQYHDVTKLTGDILARDGISVDVITGGFPCQDISTAGKQAGMGAGTRSGLWSEIVRLIGELRPRYVVVENVAALLSGPSEKRGGWFGRILGDLAECGYDAEWENIPASALGAPHRRERVWVVAYPMQSRWGLLQQPSADIIGSLNSGWKTDACAANMAVWHRKEICPPSFVRLVDGIRSRVDADFFCAFGNSVTPPIPELIGRAILAAESRHNAGSSDPVRAGVTETTVGCF